MPHDLKGVTVACRCRPLKENEDGGQVTVENDRVLVATDAGERSYKFDHAFGPDATDDIIWEQLKLPRLTQEVLRGYPTTIMAYGQTGSGKTYTIDGAAENGVVSRAATLLYDQMKHEQARFCVKVSYLQLYLEKTFDLLNPRPWFNNTTNDKRRCEHLMKQPGLKMRAEASGAWVVENLFHTECKTADDIMTWWNYGRESKQMAQTLMHAHSSRSHTLFTITVERYSDNPNALTSGPVSVGKLTIVDLAGSEKPGGSQQTRWAESVNINGSLFVLRKVIKALDAKCAHVPYRESKLTCLLNQSIGGNCYLVMLACVNPTTTTLAETIDTLSYAQTAQRIENRPRVNKDPQLELVESLEAQVEYLQRYITEDLNEPLPDMTAWKRMRRSVSASAIRRRPRSTHPAGAMHSRFKEMVVSTKAKAPSAGSTPSTNTPRGEPTSDEAPPEKNRRTSSVPCIRRVRSPSKKAKATARLPEQIIPDLPGSRTAEFLAHTADTAGITNVRALSRWFHERQKDTLYGPPRRPTRAKSGVGAGPPSARADTSNLTAAVASKARPSIKTQRQAEAQHAVAVERAASKEERSAMESYASISSPKADVLLEVAQNHGRAVDERGETASSSLSDTETSTAIPETTVKVPTAPKRNSTPRRSTGSLRKFAGNPLNTSSRPHSSRFVQVLAHAPTTTAPTTTSSALPRDVVPSNSRRAEAGEVLVPDYAAWDESALGMSPQHAAQEIASLREQNDLLLLQDDLSKEKIRDKEARFIEYQETMKDYEIHHQTRLRAQTMISEELQSAFNNAVKQSQDDEESLVQRVLALETTIKNKDKELAEVTERSRLMQSDLMTISESYGPREGEEVSELECRLLHYRLHSFSSVSKYQIVTGTRHTIPLIPRVSVKPEPTDIKGLLRGILDEWSSRNALSESGASDLRREVQMLKKKKGVMLSMMGRWEEAKLQKEIEASREGNASRVGQYVCDFE